MNRSDVWERIAQTLGVAAGLLPDTEQRLYHLQGLDADDASDPLNGLGVEAWVMHEAVDAHYDLRIVALGTEAIPISDLLRRHLRLRTTLADGSFCFRTGMIRAVKRHVLLDGQLVRYELTVVPFTWNLTRRRGSQVWQDQTLQTIVGDLLTPLSAIGGWKFAADVPDFLARGNHGGIYPYRVQYRETDWQVLSRELAREGLSHFYQEDDEAPCKHAMRIVSDTASNPEDPTSEQNNGIEIQRASSEHERDTIQVIGRSSRLQSSVTTIVGWHHESKTILAGSQPARSPTNLQFEDYFDAGHDAFSDSAAAEHYAGIRRDALDCREERCFGRSTLRSARAGTVIRVRGQHDLLGISGQGADLPKLLLTRIVHVGMNNLPAALLRAVAQHAHEAGPELVAAMADAAAIDPLDEALIKEMEASGYANAFEALDTKIPWRPETPPAPALLELDAAVVVGPDGQTQASGADEIYRDALGRVRVCFDWQRGQRPDDRLSCWLPVSQVAAHALGGAQFVPRIGQRALIGFIDGHPERPYVRGTIHTGRGEGGIDPTPGGDAPAVAGDQGVFKLANDARPSGQGNLVGIGNAPVWHGGAAQDHRNAAGISGIRGKEFGGDGFTQLAFDDQDQQLRVEFGTTQHASWLRMGHLVHQQDNYRGSFRGLGWEASTTASGALRSKQGLLFSTYSAAPNEPAGSNGAGQALVQQMLQLAQCFDEVAGTHQTVRLGTAMAAGDKAPMLQALKTVVDGMVSASGFAEAVSDADNKVTAVANGRLPHPGAPIVGVVAKGGLALVAGKDIVLGAQQSIHLGAGRDGSRAINGTARLHTGQSIGVLAGAVKAGEQAAGTGITLIAGKGDVNVQAQDDQMQIAGRGLVNVMSVAAHVDWAAAKKITVQTAGGARMVISGSGIQTECPGKITVHAASKSFSGASSEDYVLPVLPKAETTWVKLESYYDDAWNTPWPLEDARLKMNGKTVAEGLAISKS